MRNLSQKNQSIGWVIAMLLILISMGSSEYGLQHDVLRLGQQIDSIAEMVMREQHIPGLAVVIVKEGKTIIQKEYGYANMYTGAKVDADETIFRLGSVSKAITLLAISRLIDQGQLQYDDEVATYFPNIKGDGVDRAPLRVHHLLSHTTGLDQIGLDRHTWELHMSLPLRAERRPKLEDFLEKHLIQRASPGERYVYDTYGTSLAGAILEKVVDKPFAQAMRDEFFSSVGMSSSGVDLILENLPSMAVGHGFNNDAYQVMPYELYSTTPASSIDATAADMAKLLEAMTSDGSNRYGQLFSPEMLEKILDPYYRPHPDFVGTTHGLHEGFYYGQGENAFQVRSIGHGGDMLGYKTQLRILPEHKTGIFIAINRNPEAGGGDIDIDRQIVNLLHSFLAVKKRTAHKVPTQKKLDLAEYASEYYYSVFCHTCTEEQFEQGAWRPGWKQAIEIRDGFLFKGDDKYIQRQKDVFVRADGYDMLFFSRNASGKIVAMQSEDDNSTFERVE